MDSNHKRANMTFHAWKLTCVDFSSESMFSNLNNMELLLIT